MNTLNNKYTTTDIARLGIKRERLKEWLSRKYIKSGEPAKGAGTKNLFSLCDVYMIQLFRYLVKQGFSREDAASRIIGLYLVAEIAKEVITSKKKISEKNRKAALESYNRFLTSRFLLIPKRGHGVESYPFEVRFARRDGSMEEPPTVVCIVKNDDGSYDEYYPNGSKKPFSLDNYQHHDDILFINFEKIRKEVNAKLESIGS